MWYECGCRYLKEFGKGLKALFYVGKEVYVCVWCLQCCWQGSDDVFVVDEVVYQWSKELCVLYTYAETSLWNGKPGDWMLSK
jgi:hypothetical protein